MDRATAGSLVNMAVGGTSVVGEIFWRVRTAACPGETEERSMGEDINSGKER